MYKRYAVLLLILLAASVEAARRRCKPHAPYTLNSLALSWSGDFCSVEGRCIREYQNWDGKSFGIHGLWPSYNSKDLSCVLMGRKPDPFCKYDYDFNMNTISDLKSQLDTLWPQWGVNNYDSFWENQWNKHGVCYMKFLKDEFGNKYTEEEIFRSYFEVSLRLAKQHSKVSKFQFNSKQELARDLKISNPDHFYVACKGGFIFEIRLCYTLTAPGQEQLTSCYDKDFASEERCEYPLRLKEKDVEY